ncbi:MAG: c-type cytochrome [Alphaproteobacteria bacterium]
MKRVLRHPLTLTLVAIGALYAVFGHLVDPPLPKSLLIQFMIFAVIGVLMVATFDDSTCARLFAPIRALLGDPRLKVWRGIAFVIAVAGASTLTYGWAKPDLRAPVELRTVHPAPPSTIRVFGKGYNLVSLKNPLRENAPKGSDAYREIVHKGRKVYYQNCFFCHGDMLDGVGHFASAFNPRPANFQDVGTIAQLQESYLFWRITTGGPGLPREGAPWASAMPVWHEMLDEQQVWQVITFLYDYTGYEPRSWELEASAPSAKKTEAGTGGEPAPAAAGGEEGDTAAIERLYRKRCAQCHGDEGEGDGPAADLLYPRPRDFSLAVFKYKTTHADSEFPSDDDLRKTIREGLPGTSMPAWGELLSDRQIDGLIELIKEFGDWADEDVELKPIDMGKPVPSSPESIARGARLFEKACVQCHGKMGRGNVTSGKKLKDDWGYRIWPRNLTRPETWRWTRTTGDIFQRISAGIRGTPMPEHTTTMSAADRWNVANYVMTLRQHAVPFATGETVVRASRITGELPTAAGDPLWESATPITFPLVPNVIKKPRLFYSLNDAVTVRALFNGDAVALRLDIDDRTYSVPGDKEEVRYRQEGVAPTPDAVAVQFPAELAETSEKPWFRHGDPKHPVNMWYWRAPSAEPAEPERFSILDANGPDSPPVPRDDSTALSGSAVWRDGQWRVVFMRSLKTDDLLDLAFDVGRYIPIAFADWDGWAGQEGGRHALTPWYWLLLVPEENPLAVYGTSGASGIVVGLLFFVAARRERRAASEKGA